MVASRLGASSGHVAIQSNVYHQRKQPHLASLPFRACCTWRPSCEQLRCSHRRPAVLEVRKCKVTACSIQPAAKVAGGPKGGDEYGIGLRRKKLAVFVSGGGSNFRSIHQSAEQGLIHGDVVVLVTDKPGKGFYGMKVHQAVIGCGARYSGPTIHFVDENYDTGRILAQKAVPVLANDTADQLAARILSEEHKLYVDVVSALCVERIFWREDGVPLIRSKVNPNQYI